MSDHDDEHERIADDDNPRRSAPVVAAGDADGAHAGGGDAPIADADGGDRGAPPAEREGPHPRDLPGVTVLVRNITWDAREDDIRGMFEPHGNVLDVYMPKDYHTKRPKGLAFVKFAVQTEADAAIAANNNQDLLGREIRCEIAQGKAKSADEFRSQAPRRDYDRRDDRRGGYDDRRGGDRRGGYDDRRGDRDDRRGGGYDDRRGGGHDDRRGGGYDDRRGGGYDDRRRDDRPYARNDRPRGLCFDWRDGKCQRGDSCRFSHEDAAR